jgi:hypothetical protein
MQRAQQRRGDSMTINSYMNFAFCALAVISVVGVAVAVLVSY